MTITKVAACRSCGSSGLEPVLDLGQQPLANALRRPDDSTPEPRYELATVFCPVCSLVQLTATVDPEVMFDEYHYFSSYSTTMVSDMQRLAARITAERSLGPDALVVEIASNDGYLLAHYRDLGVPILGIDPARNVAEVAIERGIPTVIDYFGAEVAARLRAEGRRADVMHANNVMAHVPDINDFVAGIADLLAPAGVAIVESPYVVDLIAASEFDTIYHEHVFYYSLTAVQALVERHGLTVVDVEHLSIHGGSLRLFIAHEGAEPVRAAVTERLAAESGLGVRSAGYYAGFADRVEGLKAATVGLLDDLHGQGRRLAAYGAAAKGTVLLNHFGVDHRLIDFVVDRNEHKHGYLMPGVGIPIGPPELLLSEAPDHVLLLAWNFAAEIVEQQRAYLAAGGSFIVPIPKLEMIPS